MKAILIQAALAGIVSTLLTGCGGPSEPTEPAGHARSVADARPPAADIDAPPTETVSGFYEALRRGDEKAIAALLTDKAKTETAKSGLGIQSQGSDRLEYELGEVDYIDDSMQGAHVKSLWIDYAPDGEQLATEVIWVLRKEASGWRIAGMATQVAEGQLPLLFNFEDPEDMLQKKEYIEGQLAEENQDAVEQTANSSEPAAAEEVVR